MPEVGLPAAHPPLREICTPEAALAVWRRNAFLVGACDRDTFLYDPHGIRYTGALKLWRGWLGSLHMVTTVYYQDFVHQNSPLRASETPSHGAAAPLGWLWVAVRCAHCPAAGSGPVSLRLADTAFRASGLTLALSGRAVEPARGKAASSRRHSKALTR